MDALIAQIAIEHQLPVAPQRQRLPATGVITVDPEIFSGKPIVRGMRIAVERVLSLLAQGETPDAILADYPDLEREDIRAGLVYATAVIAQDTLDEVTVAAR